MTDENSQIENSDRFAVFFLCAECPRSGAVCIAKISRCFVIEKFSIRTEKKKERKKGKMKNRKRYVALFAVERFN